MIDHFISLRRMCYTFLLLAICTVCAWSAASSTATITTWNVTATNSKTGRKILQSACGYAQKGRVHAIIGPSGSGKTTLLNAIAGEIKRGSLTLTGEITTSLPSFRPIYIQQEDLLFPQLTVEETLLTADQLQSGGGDDSSHSHSRSQRQANVDRLTGILGLRNSLTTKVGDAKTRGLSGGEKKRLSIGSELIGGLGPSSSSHSHSQSIFLCADEPTSGLDSFQALRVVQLLRGLADEGEGATVLLSIHQPRLSMLTLFDDITLISEGRVIYSGPKEGLKGHFNRLGIVCPEGASLCEWAVDTVSVDYSTPDSAALGKKRIQELADLFAVEQKYDAIFSQTAVSSNGHRGKNHHQLILPRKRVSLLKRLRAIPSAIIKWTRTFGVLFQRSLRQIVRDKSLNIARLMSSLFSALLFGAIYYRLGMSIDTAPDRLGLMQVAAVNTAMTALIKATTSFANERLIIARELRHQTNDQANYSPMTYFLAKLAAELPFSALFPSLFGVIVYQLCGLNPAAGRLRSFLAVLVAESAASTALGMTIGAVVPSAEAGVAIAPAVMVLFIVFGGLYVVNAPFYLKWVADVSLIRWAFEGLAVNEFTGLQLVDNKGIVNGGGGAAVLQRMGLKHGPATAIQRLLAIAAFNYVLTIILLTVQQGPGRDRELLPVKFIQNDREPQPPTATSNEDQSTEKEQEDRSNANDEGDSAFQRSGSSQTRAAQEALVRPHRIGP